ncbi:Peptidase, S66 family LD-carboxypeptidase A [Desulfonema limicola]|uniref:Peptidase, S66 family LD-carboxypeptidase A n=1 Tax=Desulfonema limicola TaxID=45656 RepID=A0A975B4D5_9BACT|nr:LD-carboxypeptidase [Desulfonema limicola]QTA78574.1 Peptidase, S66 family LD-carboxypeptidase A [Desulfonema limicola]
MKTINIIKAAKLLPGDCIGIAAPSSPFKKDDFFQGISILEEMGYSVMIPDGLFKKKGYLAGSDLHRAEQLHGLFADNSVKAIICARGGFGAARILSLLDYDLIRNNPKLFIGFSDITALLYSFYKKSGLVTLHGPVVTSLKYIDKKSLESLSLAVSSGSSIEIQADNPVVISHGRSLGIVICGNLSVLCHLMGTPFQPEFDNHILIIEDIGEPSYKIDRMLTQMKLAGCFKGLSGLVLGSFKDSGRLHEIYKIVKNIFNDYSIPVIAGFDVGHGDCNLSVPIGIKAAIDTEKGILAFHEPAVINKKKGIKV